MTDTPRNPLITKRRARMLASQEAEVLTTQEVIDTMSIQEMLRMGKKIQSAAGWDKAVAKAAKTAAI